MSQHINTPENTSNRRQAKDKKKRQNTRVAFTSILAYRELVESGQLKREKDLVYKALAKHGSLNNRQISLITKLEIGSVTRSTNDLRDNKPIPLIELAEYKPCKITGRLVQYYRIIKAEKEGGAND